ncbi:MAG TPA: M28 family metallopeptidase [Gammaproteobacteria bacterium]|nr:M28 family metallopeptidase [Gammaproteobacteria bacterium]
MRSHSPALIVLGAAMIAACTSGGHGVYPPRSSAQAIEAHVRFLADDLLEGRAAGTRGYDLAALYVATEFRKLGLEPAGDAGGYFQRVPLLQGWRIADGARFVLHDGQRTWALEYGKEFVPAIDFNAVEAAISAPLVWVGYGIHAPELGYDDFAGVDLTGRLAVLMSNAPETFPHDQRAFYASSREKARALVERGAIGVVHVQTPEEEEKYPWEKWMRNLDRPGMRLIGADGRPLDGFPELRVGASVNLEVSRRLFEGAPHTLEEAIASAKAGRPLSFELPGVATITTRTRHARLASVNVAARLPGADAVRRDEHVVFTAHLDHLGVGAPVDGDAIYNGAFDNALGVAIMLETARRFARDTVRPKRSILFLAVTAEEKGLLGAQYFAESPTVPADSLVANVNLDMPLLFTPLKDVIGFGLEHSSLKTLVERAARETGFTLTPDPFPEEVIFIRSDQYPFVRRGVPAVYLIGGVTAADAGIDMAKRFTEFLRTHYHQPSDEVELGMDFEGAARFADLNHRLGTLIASATERPSWNPGDFFGERFAKKGR